MLCRHTLLDAQANVYVISLCESVPKFPVLAKYQATIVLDASASLPQVVCGLYQCLTQSRFSLETVAYTLRFCRSFTQQECLLSSERDCETLDMDEVAILDIACPPMVYHGSQIMSGLCACRKILCCKVIFALITDGYPLGMGFWCVSFIQNPANSQ